MQQSLGKDLDAFTDFILGNRPEKVPDALKSWEKGHDLPIESNDEKGSWLGRHQDMSSPGKITLHRDRLCRAFWQCMQTMPLNSRNSIAPNELHILCQSLIYMVLTHERFHHYCDVIGTLTGFRGGAKGLDYKEYWQTEEALATAWEWQEVQRSFPPFSSLPKYLKDAWLEWWFEGITAEGYKDWKYYSHACSFKHMLIRHLINQADLSNKLELECAYLQLEDMSCFDSYVTYWLSTDSSPPDNEIQPLLRGKTTGQAWIERGNTLCLANRGLNYIIEASVEICNALVKTEVENICLINNQLTSLQEIHLNLNCKDNLLTSLQDDNKNRKKMNGTLFATGNPISSHVLGLIYMKGCHRVTLDNQEVQKILNKHLQNPDRSHKEVIYCQSELLDAGYEEFAQL